MDDLPQRVIAIENHYSALESRMQAVENTLNRHGGKLDEIIAALGRRRDFDPMRIMQILVLAVGLIAAIGSAISYVTVATNDGRLAVMEFQIRQMWQRGSWQATTVVKGDRQ